MAKTGVTVTVFVWTDHDVDKWTMRLPIRYTRVPNIGEAISMGNGEPLYEVRQVVHCHPGAEWDAEVWAVPVDEAARLLQLWRDVDRSDVERAEGLGSA